MQGGHRIGIYPAGGVKWFDRASGTWRLVYELTPQLEDHADEYAYKSLGLTMRSPIGTGVPVGTLRAFGAPPSQALQAPRVAGMPTPAGQWGFNPLSGEPGFA